MNIKPKEGVRNYAKGGSVQHLARGGSAFVDPNKYPGWPQQADNQGDVPKGLSKYVRPQQIAESVPEEGGGAGGAGFRTGKGTAFVDAEKYPGWPQTGHLI